MDRRLTLLRLRTVRNNSLPAIIVTRNEEREGERERERKERCNEEHAKIAAKFQLASQECHVEDLSIQEIMVAVGHGDGVIAAAVPAGHSHKELAVRTHYVR